MRRVHQNKIGKLFVTGLLCAGILFLPLSKIGEVQKAEAQFGPISISGAFNVQDIPQTLINTIAQLSAAALEQKELVLDGLFYDIAQQALQQMTGDILKFINSGFDGEPAFITDIEEYMDEIADETAGDFIYGDELSTLCTSFQVDTRLAIAESYSKEHHGGFKEQAECTIDDTGANIDKFKNGSFSAGGYGVWFETVLNPLQTPMGGYIGGHVANEKKIAKNQAIAMKEADWGRGIKSQKKCDKNGADCSITTPGALIQEQASAALQIPMQSLLNADEMNEAIGALFGNLANQALTGVNGLLGLGGNISFSANSFGASGNISYLDAIKEEGVNNSQLNQTGGSKIQQALATETRVLQTQLAIVREIDAAITLFGDTFAPFKNDSCWNLKIPEKLSTTLDDLLIKIPKTIVTVTALQELADNFEKANSAPAQLKILQEFTAMQQQGLVTGQPALIKYDLLLNSELKKIIETFKEDIKDEKNAC